MENTQFGQMLSEIVSISMKNRYDFLLTVKLSGGEILKTNGRLVASGETDSGPDSFYFDSEYFHKEVAKGNIDIRSLCSKIKEFMES